MPITLAEARTDLRERLNESGAALYYSDSSLNTWLNEGCRDISRSSLCLWDTYRFNVTAGVGDYAGPTNFVKEHRCVFFPVKSVNQYPLEFRNLAEMDAIWGIRKDTRQYNPYYWTVWGSPPAQTITLFPIPGSDGSCLVNFYRMAAPAATDGDNLDVPEGWWDAAIVYAMYRALIKNADSRWKDMKDDYRETLMQLTSAAAGYTDNTGTFSTGMQNWPNWVFGPLGNGY